MTWSAISPRLREYTHLPHPFTVPFDITLAQMTNNIQPALDFRMDLPVRRPFRGARADPRTTMATEVTVSADMAAAAINQGLHSYQPGLIQVLTGDLVID
jgi:hypothetical protein